MAAAGLLCLGDAKPRAHGRILARRWITAVMFAASGLTAATAAAQVIERPMPFDSAGRITVITQDLAARLALVSPRWPVTGAFVDARLYAVGDTGAVLVVLREDRRVERYPLSASGLGDLRALIGEAVRARGGVATEEGNAVIVESASREFARSQKAIAGLIYAPAASLLVSDSRLSSATYALVAGGAWFFFDAFADRHRVTRPQVMLSSDAAQRGTLLAMMALYAADKLDTRPAAGAALVASIGGTIYGYRRGATLTAGEAKAAGAASTLFGFTTAGVLATAGAFDSVSRARVAIVPVVAAMAAGWMMGPSYPRHASYGVTAADVSLAGLSGWLGAITAISPLVGSGHLDQHVAAAVITGGFVGGTIIGERVFARPIDHNSSDVLRIVLAAGAGSTVAGAIPALTASAGTAVAMSAWSVGAIVGAAYAEGRVRAAKRSDSRNVRNDQAALRSRVEFSGLSAGLAAMRQPGMHTILKVSF